MIDEIDKLSNADVIERRRTEVVSVSGAMKPSPDVNTYDLFYVDPALQRMPQPEAMGRAMKELFGLK